MAEAFMYMMVVGSGTATGVAAVGLVTWRLVLKIQSKRPKKQKARSAF